MKRLLVVMLVVFLSGCSAKPSPSPTPITTSAPAAVKAEPVKESFDGFSFVIPDGWTKGTPDRDKTKAVLLLGGTDWQTAKGMIKVDVGKPAFPSPKEMANAFAKGTGGQVADETIDIDGETGVMATTSSKDMATPNRMYVFYRDGKAYLLMASASEGVDPKEALDTVRSSWKWIPKPSSN